MDGKASKARNNLKKLNDLVETIKMYEKRQKSLFLLGPGGSSPTEDVLIYVQIWKM